MIFRNPREPTLAAQCTDKCKRQMTSVITNYDDYAKVFRFFLFFRYYFFPPFFPFNISNVISRLVVCDWWSMRRRSSTGRPINEIKAQNATSMCFSHGYYIARVALRSIHTFQLSPDDCFVQSPRSDSVPVIPRSQFSFRHLYSHVLLRYTYMSLGICYYFSKQRYTKVSCKLPEIR